jgi:hypothetical protein
MPFDTRKFSRTKFEPRTAEVEVPALSAFFGDGERPVFVVRGLTFEELARADNAADRSKMMMALVESLAGGKAGDQVSALRDALGYGESTPTQVVKRHEMFVTGAVDPSITVEVAVKIADAFPIEYKIITDRIVELTGLGKILAAQNASGATPASAPV